ncbi:MAG: class I SAM-dependent methyltransferase [Candidatus Kariarchaeaceae archaeon]
MNSLSRLRQAYRKIAPSYSRLKRRPWKDFVAFFNQLHLSPTGRILDAGAGNMRNLSALDIKHDAVGLDLSRSILSGYREVDFCSNKTEPLVGVISHLPFRNRSFDLSLIIATLHHLESPQERELALSELYRTLQPGGFLILSVWRFWKAGTRWVLFKNFIKKLFFLHKHELGDIWHVWKIPEEENQFRYYHLFRKRELINLLHKANFSISLLSISGGLSNKDNYFVLAQKIDDS